MESDSCASLSQPLPETTPTSGLTVTKQKRGAKTPPPGQDSPSFRRSGPASDAERERLYQRLKPSAPTSNPVATRKERDDQAKDGVRKSREFREEGRKFVGQQVDEGRLQRERGERDRDRRKERERDKGVRERGERERVRERERDGRKERNAERSYARGREKPTDVPKSSELATPEQQSTASARPAKRDRGDDGKEPWKVLLKSHSVPSTAEQEALKAKPKRHAPPPPPPGAARRSAYNSSPDEPEEGAGPDQGDLPDSKVGGWGRGRGKGRGGWFGFNHLFYNVGTHLSSQMALVLHAC